MSLIKDPTCFKNPRNPSCIDLISTNSPYSFQNSCVIETGVSDFKISNDYFRKERVENLSLENIKTDSHGIENFLQICINTLDQTVPSKKNTYVAIV